MLAESLNQVSFRLQSFFEIVPAMDAPEVKDSAQPSFRTLFQFKRASFNQQIVDKPRKLTLRVPSVSPA